MINECYLGDVRDGLRAFAAAGIRAQTCVTSPPYWGLRDYGVAGQIGLEPTIAEYVAGMVEVFRLVRDVLAEDGTLWLNLGDSYSTQAGGVGECPGGGKQGESWKMRGKMTSPNRMPQIGLKPKDLCGIPWRVAFALQADGWWLRQDIIWSKPNPMPESVTDRCTKAHEYIFLLSRRERYYYDADAIAEPAATGDIGRVVVPDGWATGSGKHDAVTHSQRKDKLPPKDSGLADQGLRTARSLGGGAGWRENGRPPTRNKRSVWSIPSEPYPDAHFATFPQALVEPCILAGSRPGDIVLDPFMGSGTVAQVAQRLGRRWIGCELNSEYHAMIDRRSAQQGLELRAAEAD